jgi:hypothetical protein
MFMQQRGVLEDYYARMKANIGVDPQGLRAVKEVFPRHSWEKLDKEFQEFAGKLDPAAS